jgi:Arc/MetJ family transcription regulator
MWAFKGRSYGHCDTDIASESQALESASNDAMIRASRKEIPVRTTIALDDDLIAKAQAYTGVEEKSALVREALKALIQREAAKRLANLGGSQPGIKSVPRRRQDVK